MCTDAELFPHAQLSGCPIALINILALDLEMNSEHEACSCCKLPLPAAHGAFCCSFAACYKHMQLKPTSFPAEGGNLHLLHNKMHVFSSMQDMMPPE